MYKDQLQGMQEEKENMKYTVIHEIKDVNTKKCSPSSTWSKPYT